jgi:hypothetical protein
VTSPDAGMTIAWPIQGGLADVPNATEGSYVLKMEWSGQWDRKVEIKHKWPGQFFDLREYAQIQVDVYVATPSAIPEAVGVWWNPNFWTQRGCPVPAATNQWVTVSLSVDVDIDVAARDNPVWDHIPALFFEGLAGDQGVIYIDNLRLVRRRQIAFAEYDWTIKSGDHLGPGGNYFSQRDENVWVDCKGDLHLRTVHGCHDLWYCSELISNNSWGYGTYVFTIQSRVDLLDENVILGLFTWDTNAPQYHYREIDFEFGRWGDATSENAQFVIQPWDTPGNRYRFNVGACKTTTHVLRWQSNGIYFMSYYGDFTLTPSPESIIAIWLYTGSSNPPPGGENIRMNLWLIPHNGANYPANGQDTEVVITDFRYVSNLFTLFAGCFAGPGVGCTPACRCADADSDADVDLADFAKFQAAFTD